MGGDGGEEWVDRVPGGGQGQWWVSSLIHFYLIITWDHGMKMVEDH